jgi:hypothetical protein
MIGLRAGPHDPPLAGGRSPIRGELTAAFPHVPGVAGQAKILRSCLRRPKADGGRRARADRPVVRYPVLPPAHSSSGLGRRPLTAVARVRIPYAPFCRGSVRRFRVVERDRRARNAGDAHVVPTSVPPREWPFRPIAAASDCLGSGRAGGAKRKVRSVPRPPLPLRAWTG